MFRFVEPYCMNSKSYPNKIISMHCILKQNLSQKLSSEPHFLNKLALINIVSIVQIDLDKYHL